MTQALINYHARAEALEQSARRLLSKAEGEQHSPAEMDLLCATDAFMLAREDLAAELTPAAVADPVAEEIVPFSVEAADRSQPLAGGPGFDITP